MKCVFLVLLVLFDFGEQSWLDSRIVGGSTAADGQFPYQISLKYNGVHNCGGSIIRWNITLTAAHCIKDFPIGSLTVMAGSNKLNDAIPHYRVAKTIPHESYSPVTFSDDIGIIHLLTPIMPSPRVAIIPLQTQSLDGNIPCVFSGWGFTNYPNRITPNDLQYANLTTITNYECRKQLGSIVTSKMICTLTHRGQGACFGDSGGPLVSAGQQIGVVSFVTPCGLGLPDVYTRVSEYINWITINL